MRNILQTWRAPLWRALAIPAAATRVLLAIGLLGAISAASAAAVLQVTDGVLTGATGVDVDGTLYDVEFLDGSCVSVFTLCNTVGDFAFDFPWEAAAASAALLDQVLVDGPLGNFDSLPALTRGCENTTAGCNIWTPWAPGSTPRMSVAENVVDNALDRADGGPTAGKWFDTSGSADVYARWTLADTTVAAPEPATLSLLGLGLAGFGTRRWRQRRRVAPLTTLLPALVIVAAATSAEATTIYTFENSNFGPSTTTANADASGLYFDALFITCFPDGCTFYGDIVTGAFTGEFTVAAHAGYALDITGFSLDGRVRSADGPTQLDVFTSADGFASPILSGAIPHRASDFTHYSTSLSLSGLTAPLAVRIVVGGGTFGGWEPDNVTLTMEAVPIPAAVPEPMTLTLLGSGLLAAIARLRRARVSSRVVFTTGALLLATVAPRTAGAAPVVLGAAGATTNMGTDAGSLTNLINQAGLSASYTSGVTAFDAFVATTTHDSGWGSNMWTSASGTPFGWVTFDLGGLSLVDGLALWNVHLGAPATLRDFNVFADNDSDFSNGTAAALGTFLAPSEGASPVPARVFDFAAVTTRYIQLQITGNNGAGTTGFGEIVFRQPDAVTSVPEPATLTLLGVGIAGLCGRRWRQRRAPSATHHYRIRGHSAKGGWVNTMS